MDLPVKLPTVGFDHDDTLQESIELNASSSFNMDLDYTSNLLEKTKNHGLLRSPVLAKDGSRRTFTADEGPTQCYTIPRPECIKKPGIIPFNDTSEMTEVEREREHDRDVIDMSALIMNRAIMFADGAEEYTIQRPKFVKKVSPVGKNEVLNQSKDNVISKQSPNYQLSSTAQCKTHDTSLAIESFQSQYLVEKVQEHPIKDTRKPNYYRDIRETKISKNDILRDCFPNWSQMMKSEDMVHESSTDLNNIESETAGHVRLKKETDQLTCTNNNSKDTNSNYTPNTTKEITVQDRYHSPKTSESNVTKRVPRFGYSSPDTPTRAERLRAAFVRLEEAEKEIDVIDTETSTTMSKCVDNLTDTINRVAAGEGTISENRSTKRKRKNKAHSKLNTEKDKEKTTFSSKQAFEIAESAKSGDLAYKSVNNAPYDNLNIKFSHSEEVVNYDQKPSIDQSVIDSHQIISKPLTKAEHAKLCVRGMLSCGSGNKRSKSQTNQISPETKQNLESKLDHLDENTAVMQTYHQENKNNTIKELKPSGSILKAESSLGNTDGAELHDTVKKCHARSPIVRVEKLMGLKTGMPVSVNQSSALCRMLVVKAKNKYKSYTTVNNSNGNITYPSSSCKPKTKVYYVIDNKRNTLKTNTANESKDLLSSQIKTDTKIAISTEFKSEQTLQPKPFRNPIDIMDHPVNDDVEKTIYPNTENVKSSDIETVIEKQRSNLSIPTSPKPITSETLTYLVSGKIISSHKNTVALPNTHSLLTGKLEGIQQNASSNILPCPISGNTNPTIFRSTQTKYESPKSEQRSKTVAELLKIKRSEENVKGNVFSKNPLQLFARAMNGGIVQKPVVIKNAQKINRQINIPIRTEVGNSVDVKYASLITSSSHVTRTVNDTPCDKSVQFVTANSNTDGTRIVIPLSSVQNSSVSSNTTSESRSNSFNLGLVKQSTSTSHTTNNVSPGNYTCIRDPEAKLSNSVMMKERLILPTDKPSSPMMSDEPKTFSVKVGDKMYVIKPAESRQQSGTRIEGVNTTINKATKKTLPAPKPKSQTKRRKSNKAKEVKSIEKSNVNYKRKIRKMLKKSKEPFEQLINSLDLIPVQKKIKAITAISAVTKNISFSPTASTLDMTTSAGNVTKINGSGTPSENASMSINEQTQNRKLGKCLQIVSKLAVVVQINKESDGKCSQTVQLSKINNASGKASPYRRWFKYSDYLCKISFNAQGKISEIESDGLKQGFYLITESEKDLNTACGELSSKHVSAVLANYPANIDSIPNNSVAIAIGQFVEQTSKELPEFSRLDGTNIERVLKIVLGSRYSMDAGRLTDVRYDSVIDSNMSPRCHSPCFYTEKMYDYFTENDKVDKRVQSETTTKAVESVIQVKPKPVKDITSLLSGLSKPQSRNSEKAKSLKIRQRELLESCHKLKQSRQLTMIKELQPELEESEISKQDTDMAGPTAEYENITGVTTDDTVTQIEHTSETSGFKRKREVMSSSNDYETMDEYVDVETVGHDTNNNRIKENDNRQPCDESYNKCIVVTRKISRLRDQK